MGSPHLGHSGDTLWCGHLFGRFGMVTFKCFHSRWGWCLCLRGSERHFEGRRAIHPYSDDERRCAFGQRWPLGANRFCSTGFFVDFHIPGFSRKNNPHNKNNKGTSEATKNAGDSFWFFSQGELQSCKHAGVGSKKTIYCLLLFGVYRFSGESLWKCYSCFSCQVARWMIDANRE